MSEFTKGPWKYSDAFHESQVDIRDQDSRRISVCVTDPPMSVKRMEANAHLIAAAPDMYKVLESIITEMRSLGYGNAKKPLPRSIHNAKVVLAKARGEA